MEEKKLIENKENELIRRIDIRKCCQELFIDSLGDDRLKVKISYYKRKRYIDIKRMMSASIVEDNLGNIKKKFVGSAFEVNKDDTSGDITISYFARFTEEFDIGNVISKILSIC